MRTGIKLGLCLLLSCLWLGTAHASDDRTGDWIEKVLHPQNEEIRAQALSRLVLLQPSDALPFLEAINSNSLYLLNGKAVTLGSKKQDGAEDVFMIYEIYPERLLLLDKNAKPLMLPTASLQQVQISRPHRLLLAKLSSWIGIFSVDPQKRTMAYGQLQPIADTAQTRALAMALKMETHPGALRAGKEAWYSIQLNNATNAGPAKLYIDSIEANGGDNATAVLRAYAKKTGAPREAAAFAAKTADKLDSHYAWLQRIQNLFSGISLGSILILVSLGLAIVYGLAGIINMAHGEFLMIGAYATYCTELFFNNVLHIQNGNWFFITALPVSFTAAGLMGLFLEWLIIRRLYARPLESLLATWGVSLILIQAARTIFGDLTAVKQPEMFAGGWQVSPHLVLPYNRLFIILFTIVVVVALYGMLFRTRLGMQIRAVTQNRNMSACLGIDTRRVDAFTFFIGAGLAGLAGCAMTLIGNVVPDMGQTYIVDSFLVVVTGGVGKLVGTITAGLGIGIFSKVLEAFFQAVYGKVLILLLIMIYMQFKPRGLFPDKGRIAED